MEQEEDFDLTTPYHLRDPHPLLKNSKFTAGKYKGQHVGRVIKENPNYIWWCTCFLLEPSFFFSLSKEQLAFLFKQLESTT